MIEFSQPWLIRADAGASIGAGHVMRCLALVEALQAHAPSPPPAIHLAASIMPKRLAERLAAEGIAVHTIEGTRGSLADARATAALARQLGADWAVVDGYAFDPDFHAEIKATGTKLLVIDDLGTRTDIAPDVLLNQNLAAAPKLYPNRDRQTRMLLGTRFALLRREFWPYRGQPREVAKVARQVLVTLGGADPQNVTGRVVKALHGVSDIEATIVVGSANPHRTVIESLIEGTNMRIAVDPPNMADLMAAADMGICAAGSTVWEAAAMGLPSLLAVLADNQKHVAIETAALGAAESLGWHGDLHADVIAERTAALLGDFRRRQEMAIIGKRLVDGFGADRVLDAMASPSLVIRPATSADCRSLWEWVNDPVVRQLSFSQNAIPWESHAKWFAKTLADPNGYLFVGTTPAGERAAQVRFNVSADSPSEAVVSVSVNPAMRGNGIGKRIIALATRELFRISGVRQVHAYIKPENKASLRAFVRANYHRNGRAMVKNVTAEHFVCTRVDA